MNRKSILSCGVTLICLFLSGSVRAADVPPVPADLKTEGLVVDDYDHGIFAGPFEIMDDKGSTLKLSQSDDGRGKCLLMTGDIKPGGALGLWHHMGMDWSGSVRQNWSNAKSIQILAYASRPATMTFKLKGDLDRNYVAQVPIKQGGVWQRVVVPTSQFENIAAGLGVIKDMDVVIISDEAGPITIALDEFRVDGGVSQGDDGKPLVLDPKIIFAETLVPPTERSHKTYVVATTGDDANAGTVDKPFRTIQHAADLTLPGDTVLVRAGKYIENGVEDQAGVNVTRSGAPDAWITYAGYPGDSKPLVDSSTFCTVRLFHVAYVEFRGFELTTSKMAANTFKGDEYTQFHDQNMGSGIGVDHGHHIRFINNTVHDCGGGGMGSGFSDYVLVEGNTVYNNSWRAIWNCSGISLWENRDFDDAPGYHSIIRRNFSYSNENRGPTTLFGGKMTDGNGIIIDYHRGKSALLIENNVVYDNGGRGIHVFQSHDAHVTVRNNTAAYNGRTNGDAGIMMISTDHVDVDNNIIVGRPGQSLAPISEEGDNVLYHNNIFAGYDSFGNPRVKPELNRIGADPKFVAATIDEATLKGNPNFRLSPGSPAIDVATGEIPAEDITGARRPQGKAGDLGAYER